MIVSYKEASFSSISIPNIHLSMAYKVIVCVNDYLLFEKWEMVMVVRSCKRESEWEIRRERLSERYKMCYCFTVIINVIMISYSWSMIMDIDWLIEGLNNWNWCNIGTLMWISLSASLSLSKSIIFFFVRCCVRFARSTHRVWHVQLTQILIAMNDCAMEEKTIFRLSYSRTRTFEAFLQWYFGHYI